MEEISLVNMVDRETGLKKDLRGCREDFDYILMIVPPNLEILTINALCASDRVLIPVSTDYLYLIGVDLLLGTVDKVRDNLNEDLDIFKENHSLLGIISERVRVKDNILASMPLGEFDPGHKTAKEYKEVTDKIVGLAK